MFISIGFVGLLVCWFVGEVLGVPYSLTLSLLDSILFSKREHWEKSGLNRKTIQCDEREIRDRKRGSRRERIIAFFFIDTFREGLSKFSHSSELKSGEFITCFPM